VRVADLGEVSRNLLGAGIVLGVIASTLFFSIFLFSPFESAKAFAIRWLVIALLPVLGIRLVQRWLRPDPDQPGAPAWWLVLLAAFLGLVALSTVCSVVPAVSLWGSTARSFGGLTIAGLVILSAAASETDQKLWRPRALQAVVLASLPVVLYGVLQSQGEDPLPIKPYLHRGASFLGNPNWVGAWLVMAVPLTCAALVAGGSEGTRSKLRIRERAFLGALLALQIVVAVQLRARAALLGMGVALFFFTVFVAILARRRLIWIVGSALAVGAVLTVLVVGFDRVVPENNATSLQRIVLWEAAVRLISADPSRIATGYGPDTFGFVVGPFYPEDSPASTLFNTKFWDRAHSFPLDALATLGLAGTLLFLALVGAVVCVGLERAGILRTRGDQCKALVVSLAGGLIGALSGTRFFGSSALAYPGFGAGLLGGLAIFMLVRACSRKSEPVGFSRLPASQVTGSALVAAILGHLAEIQVGFQLVSTGVLFWVYAGLVLAQAPRSGAEPPRRSREEEESLVPAPWRDAVVEALVVATVVATIAVSLPISTARWGDWRVVVLLGATWIVAVVITSLEPTATGGGRLRQRWTVIAGASLVWSGLSLFMLAVARPEWPARGPLALFAFLTASLVLMAIVQDGTLAPSRRRAAFWRPWLLLIALEVAALWPAYRLAVAPMLADTSAQMASVFLDTNSASSFLKERDLDRAITFLRDAVRRAPWNDAYVGMLGGAYLEKAKRAAPAGLWLIRSEALILEAMQRNPLLARYPFYLGAIYVLWADLAPSSRAHYLGESRRYTLLALRLDPVRSRQAVERQISAILLRQGMAQDVATSEAKRLVSDVAQKRR
jgi:O-antigen ligase